MYIVKAGTTEIHGEHEKLSAGKIVKGINAIDTFTFTILPSNVGFDKLQDFTTVVSVYNTNKNRYEFRGRVLYTSTKMADNGLIAKEVTCESFMGYLCDGVQAYVAKQTWTVRGLLERIIEQHNSLVDHRQRFTVRNVEVEDPSDGLECDLQRENTWETIKKKLLDVLGGELQITPIISEWGGIDGHYLDYLPQIGEAKDTEIALSKNMRSITRERDPSDIITKLIPLGEKLGDDTEERLTIADANNGTIYIYDETALGMYGTHVGYVEFDDVKNPYVLLSRGRKWLKENNRVPVNYSVTTLDLSLLGLDFDDFEVGNSHPIKNALLGIDDTARIIKKNIDICDESKNTIEVGEKFKTATEIYHDQKKETAAAVKVISRVSGDYVSKHDNAQVVKMLNGFSAGTENFVIREDASICTKNGEFRQCTIYETCKIYGAVLSDTICSNVFQDSAAGVNADGSLKFGKYDGTHYGYMLCVQNAMSDGGTERSGLDVSVGADEEAIFLGVEISSLGWRSGVVANAGNARIASKGGGESYVDASLGKVNIYGTDTVSIASGKGICLIGIPTSDPHVVGMLWRSGTDLKISEG